MGGSRLTLPIYMRILLDCRTLSTDPPNAQERLFILSCAPILTQKKGVEWVFLVDKGNPDALSPDIGLSLPVARTMAGPVGRWLWSRWQLPGIVKKLKADLVMTAKEISRTPGAADERYRPLSGEEKAEIKQRYAEGKEYLLAGVAGVRPEEVVDLLKAFSLFKKRQRSNMQLVLGGEGLVHGWGIGLAGKLANYKYRADIHLYNGANGADPHGSDGMDLHRADGPDPHWNNDPGEEWRRLVGAAYVFISFAGKDPPGLAMLNAWKSGTPVIVTGEHSLQGPGGEAALYPEPGDPASLAALLMSLYTNEGLRAELIGKAMNRVRSFSWERSAAQVWEGILRATNTQ
jgi:glycosyltransferase involved in cell wall biosynthesis